MIKFGNFKDVVNVITAFTKTHSPELLVGLGVAGMATGTVLAVRATPKAVAKIDKVVEEKNEELVDIAVAAHQQQYSPITKLEPLEVVKLCWKDYAPAAITSVAGIICIIGGTNISLRRNAALVTAVKLSEVTIKDLQEYKNKVVETIGEEKSDAIEAEIDKEHLDKSVVDFDNSFIPGSGSTLFFDKLGGGYFRSDKETIREAINRLNHTMNDDMYVSLNDFYDEMGMQQTVAGRELGWNRDRGLIEPRFSAQLTHSGIPVAVFSTRLEPRVNYGDLH